MFASSFCLGVFCLFYQFLLQKSPYFKLNRLYLLGSAALAVCLPLLNISVEQGWNMGLVWLETVQIGVNDLYNEQSLPVFQAYFWKNTIWWIYVVGVVWASSKLIMQLFIFFKIIRHNKGIKQGNIVLIESETLPTFSFFNYLIFNTKHTLSPTERTQILQHEQAHIEQRHTWDILFFEVLGIVFWWNPFVYLYKRQIRDVHEYLADQAVIGQHTNLATAYSKLIIRQALAWQAFSLSNHFSQPQIKKRITMLQSISKMPFAAVRYLLLLPIVALLAIVFSCNAQTDLAAANDGDKVYDEVEQMPEYNGGMQALFKFMGEHIKYPPEAKKDKAEGKSLIEFVIDETGKVTQAAIKKGFHDACDKEALRVVNAMPDWTPGKHKGEAVKVAFVLPVMFKMSDDEAEK